MSFEKMICVITIIIFLVFIVSVACYCPDSLQTLKVVQKCPDNVTAWQESASRKNCSTYKQNCTVSSSFMYHCLINTFLDKMIEVCAPTAFITDYCCEFNTRGAVVQRNYHADCRHFSTKPCDEPYFSYEGYKYPECYALVNKNTEQKNTVTSIYTTTSGGNGGEVFGTKEILIVTMTVIAVCCAILIWTLVIKRDKRKRHSNALYSSCAIKQGFEITEEPQCRILRKTLQYDMELHNATSDFNSGPKAEIKKYREDRSRKARKKRPHEDVT